MVSIRDDTDGHPTGVPGVVPVASKTDVQGTAGCGGRHRSLPPVDTPYGMPVTSLDLPIAQANEAEILKRESFRGSFFRRNKWARQEYRSRYHGSGADPMSHWSFHRIPHCGLTAAV